MYPACTLENVKLSMLSRRSLFSGSATAGLVAIAAGMTMARPALVIDLTRRGQLAAGRTAGHREPGGP